MMNNKENTKHVFFFQQTQRMCVNVKRKGVGGGGVFVRKRTFKWASLGCEWASKVGQFWRFLMEELSAPGDRGHAAPGLGDEGASEDREQKHKQRGEGDDERLETSRSGHCHLVRGVWPLVGSGRGLAAQAALAAGRGAATSQRWSAASLGGRLLVVRVLVLALGLLRLILTLGVGVGVVVVVGVAVVVVLLGLLLLGAEAGRGGCLGVCGGTAALGATLSVVLLLLLLLLMLLVLLLLLLLRRLLGGGSWTGVGVLLVSDLYRRPQPRNPVLCHRSVGSTESPDLDRRLSWAPL